MANPHSAADRSGKRPAPLAHLYVLASGNRIKVGIAQDLTRRVQALSAGNPGAISVAGARLVRRAGARALEALVHRRLKPYAIGREWFVGVSHRDALAVIDEIVADQPPPDPADVAALEARSAVEMERRMVKFMDLRRV